MKEGPWGTRALHSRPQIERPFIARSACITTLYPLPDVSAKRSIAPVKYRQDICAEQYIHKYTYLCAIVLVFLRAPAACRTRATGGVGCVKNRSNLSDHRCRPQKKAFRLDRGAGCSSEDVEQPGQAGAYPPGEGRRKRCEINAAPRLDFKCRPDSKIDELLKIL